MKNKTIGLLGVAGFAFASTIAGTVSSAQAEPNVVVSIKPLYSLVSKVMDGIATPDLLITGSESPHNFSLRPSQAANLQDADAIFWIGHGLESSLEKPIENIGGKSRTVSLMETKGVTLFGYREIATIGSGDGDHDHDHEDHAAKKDHDHDHDDHAAKKDDDHDDHAGHDHDHAGQKDAHIWLSHENAVVMVGAIVENLSAIDAVNAETYQKNGAELVAELEGLEAEITPILASVKDAVYMVFHDAYQYFESEFGLVPSGVITVSPEAQVSAARMKELREAVTGQNVSCVFSEPQFNPSIVNTLIDGTPVRTVTLDPLGASLEPGPELYGQLIREMAVSFRDCLAPIG